jgi:hypothetical protein
LVEFGRIDQVERLSEDWSQQSRLGSPRSLPARSTGKGPGNIVGGSSQAADKFDSLFGGMQDEPEFGFGGSVSNSNSNSDARSVSGSEEGAGCERGLDLHIPLP